MKKVNLIGKRIGMLTVVSRKTENKRSYYLCKCDCGNEKWIRIDALRKATSCGCIREKKIKSNAEEFVKAHLEKNIIENVNVSLLLRDKPISKNKSGVTGVSWCHEKCKWVAQIGFKGKVYYLGRYENKEDAIKARKDAEEKLHKQFLIEKGLID